MAEQVSSTSRGLSRQVVQLMLEMNSILRRNGISIALTGPHVYEEIVRASETIDDAALAQLRQHLIAAVTETQATVATDAIPATPSILQPAVSERIRTAAPVQPAAASPQPVPRSHTATVAPPSMPAASTPAQSIAAPPDHQPAPPTVRMVYPRDLQRGQLTCPLCGNAVAVSAVHLAADNPMPLQCRCGTSFKIGAESRKYPRKVVELPGRYVLLKSGEIGSVVVDDISFGGMRFHTDGDSSIQYNDELKIDFKLNDQSRSIISVQAHACYVSSPSVGVEFAPTDEFNPQLALYLMQ